MQEVISVKGQDARSYKENGSNGGDVRINLMAENQQVLITGSHNANLTVEDDLVIDARGGDGAVGKIGQQGAKGARGARGRDAQWYAVGSNYEYRPAAYFCDYF
jgi:hypothetical protein